MIVRFDQALTNRLTDALGLRPYAEVAGFQPSSRLDRYPPTPELDKMLAARDHGGSFAVQEFLDWLLDEKKYLLYRLDETIDAEYPVYVDRGELMREFFGIDSTAVERERQAVLDYVRRTTP